MFGLFKPSRTSGLARGTTLQRRVLCFSPDPAAFDRLALDSLSDVMEIKVFRSKARKRIKPEVKTFHATRISPDVDKKKSPQQQAAGSIK